MRRIAAVVLVALVVAVAGVGWWWSGRRDPATWELVPGQQVDAATTRLQVRVSPDGCTSGRVDDLSEPRVRTEADRVVVTFDVAPLGGLFGASATCPGAFVEREVVLPEPLGHRRLVDGTCPGYRRTPGVTECVQAPAP